MEVVYILVVAVITQLHTSVKTHYTPKKCEYVECIISRVNSNVNYGLYMITMCLCRFINSNKCTTLMRDADNESSSECLVVGSI